MKDNSTAQHPLAKMTRLDEELGLYDDGARVPYAGLEGAEDWEVGPCVNHLGNVTSWDICVPREPNATGVGVVASIYSGEKVARAILAAIKDNISTEALTRAPVSQDAAQLVERLRGAQAARDAFVAARERMNAAIPDPVEATPAERALYDERYKADHEAEREHRRTALSLFVDGVIEQAIEALTRVQPSTGLDMGAQQARGEPSEAMIEAGLSNLRDRRLLKWLFCEHPEDSAAIGYVDRPLDLDVQREVVAAIYKSMRAVSPETHQGDSTK